MRPNLHPHPGALRPLGFSAALETYAGPRFRMSNIAPVMTKMTITTAVTMKIVSLEAAVVLYEEEEEITALLV